MTDRRRATARQAKNQKPRPPRSVGAGLCIAALVALIAGIVANNPDDFSGDRLPFPSSIVGGDSAPAHLSSVLYDIAIEKISAPSDAGEGGAIEALGDEIFLMTRLGEFYRLAPGTESFRRITLHAPAPVVREGVFYKRPKDFTSLGYKDLKLRAVGDGMEITVSEARVFAVTPCVAIVVSQTVVPQDDLLSGGEPPEWREVWRSKPCIASAGGSFPFQSGGDMAFLEDGRLAIFVGDFGVDGFNRKTEGVDPQTLDNDYGKVIAINPATGGSEILSRGHRNPGGLAIGPDGALWQSEHGAQGGDEINRIVAGGNYGWPLETYGVHYGTKDWPLDQTTGDHDRFTRPVYAFVPSMAMSSLALMAGAEFPLWNDDLILGTLKYQRLMRLHIREGRVIFAEPLRLNARVRDLTVDDRGVIYVKDDVRPFIYRLTNDTGATPVAGAAGAALAAAGCAACHDGSNAAPSLENLFGRNIASLKGYSYSSALNGKHGAWNRDALRSFLTDPQRFAPGTTMPAPDLSEAQIDALVQALEG